jgi:hypothetical protein
MRLLRVLGWAGPWIGLAFFAWRQQTLEANLTEWVAKVTRLVELNLGRIADVAEEERTESQHGVVRAP